MGSPSNSFVGAINGAQGLIGSGPATPQTDAALSPRLLDILQYHGQTHKRTLSDITPLNDDRRTVVGSLPERPASTVGYETPRQNPAGGIMQRLEVAYQGRNGKSTPSHAKSDAADTIESDVPWRTAPTILHQENQVLGPEESTLSPLESTAAVPRISIQADNSIPSDTSSLTAVDGSEPQHPMIPDPVDARTSNGARDLRNGQGVDGVRNSRRVDDTRSNHGAPDSRSSRGEGGLRKVSDARKPGPQRPEPPGQQICTCYHDPPALPSVKTGYDPATLNLKPLEQTPSRSSSTRRKSKRTILTYDHVSRLT